jgi:hypothetical protein
VNGNLALSRALGDFAFKNNENMSAREQIVTGGLILMKKIHSNKQLTFSLSGS